MKKSLFCALLFSTLTALGFSAAAHASRGKDYQWDKREYHDNRGGWRGHERYGRYTAYRPAYVYYPRPIYYAPVRAYPVYYQPQPGFSVYFGR